MVGPLVITIRYPDALLGEVYRLEVTVQHQEAPWSGSDEGWA